MDEEKKIMEKRSSFRGWKERNKGKISQKRNVVGIVVVLSIFFVLMAYSYLNNVDNDHLSNDSIKGENNTTVVSSSKVNKTPSPTPVKTAKVDKNSTSNITKKIPIGKIGVPLINNGFEITLKSITPTDVRMGIWISVRNVENNEKAFKIGPGTIMIDNMGQQYENIKVARSAEIAQTNLSAQAMREGAIFFERLKDGRTPKKIILHINNDKIEFALDSSIV